MANDRNFLIPCLFMAVAVLGNGVFWHYRYASGRRSLASTLAWGTVWSVAFVSLPFVVVHAIVVRLVDAPGGALAWYEPFASPTWYVSYVVFSAIAGAGMTMPWIAYRSRPTPK